MAFASHLQGLGNAGAWRAHGGGQSFARALLPIILGVLAPAGASGDIYQWTDERGGTVISDVLPVDPGKVSGLKLLAATTKRDARPPAHAAPTPAELALAARIEELERQLQAQQHPPQPQTAPRSSHPGDDNAAPVPPPPETAYASGGDAEVQAAYYPGYYYPPPPAYSIIVVPAKPKRHGPASVRRPAFAPRPQFVGRQPQFVSRPPEFVSRTPQFIAEAASGNIDHAAFGGRPAHRGDPPRRRR